MHPQKKSLFLITISPVREREQLLQVTNNTLYFGEKQTRQTNLYTLNVKRFQAIQMLVN